MTNSMHLVINLDGKDIKKESNRKGFGRGLLEAGKRNENIVGLCADLTESTQMVHFAEEFPSRYIEVGVAEQNLVTVGSGLAAVGKVPFVSSYGAFCPGRCWEQIRTTICLNEQPVKIVGSHVGLSVGPDGATHQMFEDTALMRSLPHMKVFSPCDSVEAEKITLAMAEDDSPNYIRLSRSDTPIFTTSKTPFEIGKAYVFREGHDITIVSTGGLTYQALMAAHTLEKDGIHAEVIHVPTIKPFDEKTVLTSAHKTGRVITVEEGQIAGGLGGLVAETLCEQLPTPLKRLGMADRFGESGQPDELMEYFRLDAPHIAMIAHNMLS